MQTNANRHWAPSSLISLAIIALLFLSQLVAIARHRLDYPIVDDWRYYINGPAYTLPESLSFKWLFAPAADTIHVTGKLADWLILNWLAHDYTVLAAVSFGLFFGGWLMASVAFCFEAARGDRPVLLASLAVFLLCLAGVPYWVTLTPSQYLEPVIAYHQMLPMVGLSILALLCMPGRANWPRTLVFLLAAITTPIFALAYSSGAVMLVFFGSGILILWTACRVSDPEIDKTLAALALVIFIMAAACLAAHVMIPLDQYGVNPALRSRSTIPYASPFGSQFWLFLFALFDRAVLSTNIDWVSQLRGVTIVFIVVVPAAGLAIQLARNVYSGRQRGMVIVLVATLASVLSYAALVSYGRGSYGRFYFPEILEPASRSILYAHSRFFYWWITAILPLSVIAWWAWLGEFLPRRFVTGIVAFVAIWLLVPKGQISGSYGGYFHHWNHSALYARDADEVANLIEVDVQRSRNKPGQPRRAMEWRALDPTRRNPFYYFQGVEFALNAQPAQLYQRAIKRNATFVKRWGFGGKSQ